MVYSLKLLDMDATLGFRCWRMFYVKHFLCQSAGSSGLFPRWGLLGIPALCTDKLFVSGALYARLWCMAAGCASPHPDRKGSVQKCFTKY